jgi:hypothetical protein
VLGCLPMQTPSAAPCKDSAEDETSAGDHVVAESGWAGARNDMRQDASDQHDPTTCCRETANPERPMIVRERQQHPHPTSNHYRSAEFEQQRAGGQGTRDCAPLAEPRHCADSVERTEDEHQECQCERTHGLQDGFHAGVS